jgi:hypothetical protein
LQRKEICGKLRERKSSFKKLKKKGGGKNEKNFMDESA